MPRRRKPVDTTTLDRFGRVLLPKPLRDRVGIRPGDDLRVAVEGGHLVLEPVREVPRIEVRNGIPVLVGYTVPPGFDWKGLIRRDREERLRKILGEHRAR
jgi:AbrB family looped-hinge helix DNA binding protein